MNYEPKVLVDNKTDDAMRRMSFQPCELVCCSRIDIVTLGETILQVFFCGGCNGNTQAVAALVSGMKVRDAIAKLEGINCNGKGTSCPDQLARALKQMLPE